MIAEIHLIQHVAPSLLNRDDTGMHKRQKLGGRLRLSLSPQCQKRAIRLGFRESFDPRNFGVRSLLIPRKVHDTLLSQGWDEQDAERVVKAAFAAAGIPLKTGLESDVLLFAPSLAIEEIVAICHRNREGLLKTTKNGVAKAVRSEMSAALDAGRSVDIALSGRMIAETQSVMEKVHAAVQMAHAVGTSTASQSAEFDYFTAVDELETAHHGAGHINSSEFGSTVFYRYATVDGGQLTKNLEADRELAIRAIEAFTKSMIESLPSGTQHNAAAHNLPSLVMVVVRAHAPLSLANAFVKPIVPTPQHDLIAGSIHAFDDFASRMGTMYGSMGLIARAVCVDRAYSGELTYLKDDRVDSIEEVVRLAQLAIPDSLDGS